MALADFDFDAFQDSQFNLNPAVELAAKRRKKSSAVEPQPNQGRARPSRRAARSMFRSMHLAAGWDRRAGTFPLFQL
jgi:hypothetical protein